MLGLIQLGFLLRLGTLLEAGCCPRVPQRRPLDALSPALASLLLPPPHELFQLYSRSSACWRLLSAPSSTCWRPSEPTWIPKCAPTREPMTPVTAVSMAETTPDLTPKPASTPIPIRAMTKSARTT